MTDAGTGEGGTGRRRSYLRLSDLQRLRERRQLATERKKLRPEKLKWRQTGMDDDDWPD